MSRRHLLLTLLLMLAVLLPGRLMAQTTPTANDYDAYGRPLRLQLHPDRYAGPPPTDRPAASNTDLDAAAAWGGWSDSVFMELRPNGWHVFTYSDGQRRDLTPGGGLHVEPDIARGGQKVLYSTLVGDALDIIRMNADGSSRTLLTDSSHDESWARWSPDGTRIAYESYAFGAPEIYVMDENGRNKQRLTNNTAYDGWPTWSPDGSQIVYSSTGSGRFQLWLMGADGSNKRMLTNDLGFVAYPAWSPNGKQIAFSGTRPGGEWLTVYTYEVATGSVRELLPPEYLIDRLVSGWTPDGNSVTYTDVNYILVNGQYRWTHTLPMWIGETGQSMISFNPTTDTIWHPRIQTRDVTPVQLTLDIPPDSLLPAPQSLTWTIDPYFGPPPHAPLRAFQLQMMGYGTVWPSLDLVTTIAPYETSYPMDPIARPTRYRIRTVDEALNYGPWQTLPFPVTIYSGLFSARVTDHTGVPVQGAVLNATPAPLHVAPTDADGRLTAFLVGPGLLSTRWTAPNYGTLPTQRWSVSGVTPIERYVVLPPADNVVPGGQFESSPGEWQPVGDGMPAVRTNSAYSGAVALRLGRAAGDPLPGAAGTQISVTIPAAMPNPTLSLHVRQPLASVAADRGLDIWVTPAGRAAERVATLRAPYDAWTLVNADLSAYAGQTVTLSLRPQLAAQDVLLIEVDDVAIGAARPDLWVTAQTSEAVIAAGETVTLTVQIGNRGRVAAPNARLNVTLPAGLTIETADPPPAAGTLRWNLGDLPAAAAEQTITLRLRASDATSAQPRRVILTLAGAIEETETTNNRLEQPVLVGYRLVLPILQRP